MNLVFYGRYSDSGQSEQSIEGQRKVCYEFAERNGYRIIGEYIDRAISGTGAENRPDFLRMIADSAKRQFQGVLVYQLDRFARNRYDSATYKTKLKKNGVKTSQGNSYNKSSIHRILINRKYLGIYIYGDLEIPGGIPQIIDEITFEQAQLLMAKNRKAPARAKAIEEHYLLTTALFCGHCETAMTGVSGTSKTGKIHQYYSCVTQQMKRGCKKQTVRKAYIEDKVVTNVLAVLTDDYIDTIAQKISDLSAKESNSDTLKRLKRLLKENEEATANLVKAIEAGKAVEVFSAQIEKRQAERNDLETQLAQEKMIRPILTFDEVKFFFEKFKNGDASDISYRTALIDTFVNKIYLYDGDDARIEIYCNADNQGIKIPIDKPDKSSSMERLVRPARVELTTY